MKEIKDLGFGIIQVNEPKPTMSKMESVDNYLCKWQKLKELVIKYADNYDESISSICYLILEKMQELEKGEKDDNC